MQRPESSEDGVSATADVRGMRCPGRSVATPSALRVTFFFRTAKRIPASPRRPQAATPLVAASSAGRPAIPQTSASFSARRREEKPARDCGADTGHPFVNGAFPEIGRVRPAATTDVAQRPASFFSSSFTQ